MKLRLLDNRWDPRILRPRFRATVFVHWAEDDMVEQAYRAFERSERARRAAEARWCKYRQRRRDG